jgi:hypothetical protein
MQNRHQEPYLDSPTSSRSSSPIFEGRINVAKPLPSLPTDAPPSFEEAYRDEPSDITEIYSPSITTPRPQRYRASSTDILNHHVVAQHYVSYTDNPSGESDDDVPLAHLYPYPTEAPPAYHVAVRQSYRDTLIAHIPVNFTGDEEEGGEEGEREDDLRFSIERVIAGLIVVMILLVVCLLLIWQALKIYFGL